MPLIQNKGRRQQRMSWLAREPMHFQLSHNEGGERSPSAVDRGGFQGFRNPLWTMKLPIISSKGERNSEGITGYIEGYNVIIIMKTSKRSTRQHSLATYPKHDVRLKVTKCTKFSFRTSHQR